MSDEHNQRLGSGAVSLTLLTALLLSATSVGNRFAVDTVPPIAVGGIRFGLAAVFMLAWCRFERAPLWPSAGQWQPSFLAGLLLFLHPVLLDQTWLAWTWWIPVSASIAAVVTLAVSSRGADETG